MAIRHTSYWQGEPLSDLPRSRLEQAAEAAIGELMQIAEQQQRRQAGDMAVIAFVAGALLAGFGALFGVLFAH
jgi:hypothetical protein